MGTIAKELGLHHETVQRALSDAPRPRPAPKPSLFDPYVDFVREVLGRYPRLASTRLWHMLRERDCPLSVRQVRDKVRELRPSRREAFLTRRTFPGEEGQVDWASFGHLMIGAARRALSAFLLTLTFSRWFFLRFFLDQSLENFLRGHVYAFEDFHGAPRYNLYDNLRSAVVERYREGVRFNPRLLELASHYHFAPRACRPGRGSEKGAVERAVRYVRDSFFAARSFTTLEDLNRQALAWRDEVAGARRWPGDDRKTVAQAFEEEAPHLLTLPTHRLETDLVVAAHSEKTIYIRYDLNDYSIPPTSVGRPLTLIASETTVRILGRPPQGAARWVGAGVLLPHKPGRASSGSGSRLGLPPRGAPHELRQLQHGHRDEAEGQAHDQCEGGKSVGHEVDPEEVEGEQRQGQAHERRGIPACAAARRERATTNCRSRSSGGRSAGGNVVSSRATAR